MARAKAQPVDFEQLATRAVALVAAHGAVPRAEWKAFRAHLGMLEPLIVARGLEVCAATIRRPLDRQVLELVRANSFVAVKGLEKRVAGATAREVGTAVNGLVSSGALVRVVREHGPGVALDEVDVLDREAIADLVRRTARLQKLLRSATTKKSSVLASDVEALLGRGPERGPERGHERGSADEGVVSKGARSLIDEIARRVRTSALPVRVPELLRALGAPFEESKRALIDGAARGLFDLEPESGMNRLSPEDAQLCPAGPMGTRLSWVRARARAGAAS